MANYSDNQLVVEGNIDDVKAFLTKVGDGTNFMERFDTMPAELAPPESRDPHTRAHLKRAYGAEDWSEWQETNWGSLGFHLDTLVTRENPAEGTAQFTATFSTAYTPPIAGIALVAQQHPELSFRLYHDASVWEGGSGLAEFADGIEVGRWDDQ